MHYEKSAKKSLFESVARVFQEYCKDCAYTFTRYQSSDEGSRRASSCPYWGDRSSHVPGRCVRCGGDNMRSKELDYERRAKKVQKRLDKIREEG